MKKKSIFKFCCEHCNRTSDLEQRIIDHEARCARNPTRVCGFCQEAELQQKKVGVLVSVFRHSGLPALRKAANDCPACILATILQNSMTHPDERHEWLEHFDYKSEARDFWATRLQTAKQ